MADQIVRQATQTSSPAQATPSGVDDTKKPYAALLAEAEASGVDHIRLALSRTSLGAGLETGMARYMGRDDVNSPLVELGDFEFFKLGGFAVEVETNPDFHCRAYLTWPNGLSDTGTPVREMLAIARLLSRPEVLSALERWIALEAAATATTKGGAA